LDFEASRCVRNLGWATVLPSPARNRQHRSVNAPLDRCRYNNVGVGLIGLCGPLTMPLARCDPDVALDLLRGAYWQAPYAQLLDYHNDPSSLALEETAQPACAFGGCANKCHSHSCSSPSR
jgi:hypothetical protein